MTTADDILKVVLPAIRKALRKKQNQYIKLHSTYLQEFEAKLNQFFSGFQTRKMEKNTFRSILNSANNFSVQLEEWIDTIEYIQDEFSTDSFWLDWQAQFETILNNFPQKIQLEMKEDPGENKLQKTLFKSAAALHKLKGKIRKSDGKTELRTHSFNLRNLMQSEIELPLSHFLLSEVQHFFKVINRHLLQLNELTNQIKNRIFEQQVTAAFCSGSENEILPEEFLKTLTGVKEEISGLRKESNARLKTEFEKISAEFRKIYKLAGTFSHSASKFSEKAIKQKKSGQEKYFNLNKDTWQKQLNGCKEEWSKDLKIESFQLKTYLDCFDTRERLANKLEARILTAFSEVEEILKISATKVEELEIEDATDLKKAIFSENRALLKDLRLAKLPEIMDAIVQTNIASEYEQFLEKIKTHAAQFPEKHVAFKTLDTGNLLPLSKLDDIPQKWKI